MTTAELKESARHCGESAVLSIKCAAYNHSHAYYEERAVHSARLAAHSANLYFERIRVRDSLVTTVLDNAATFRQRQAQTPRCNYRKVTEATDKKTDTVTHSIGDPCGGKLKVMKRAGKEVGLECVACGRSMQVPQAEGVAEEKKEAA